MTLARGLSLTLAAAAGATTVFAFAPFGASGVVVVTLTLLFALWQRARSPREAAQEGFAFGIGLFGAGSSWLTIALANFGGMPLWLALLAIAILTAYLALWPALAGYLAVRLTAHDTWPRVFVAAAAYTLTEWIRSYLFTGFPWLALGYTQVPGGLAAGYAPVGGVYLVTLVVALVAALLTQLAGSLAASATRRALTSAAGIVVLGAAGAALGGVAWTHASGTPLSVSLVQGNVLQALKFDPRFRTATFDRYLELVAMSRGRLIVLPESAFPMFSDEVPDNVLLSLIRTAIARDGDVLLGLFTALPPEPGSDEPRYYNTVVALGSGAAAVLPQEPSRALRRNDTAEAGHRLVRALGARHSARRPGARRREATPACRRRRAGRRRHLLRGCLRRRAAPWRADARPARERDQRRVVRPLDRGRAARPDRRDARAGVRPSDAAGDEHRHHLGDRPRRPRTRAAAVVHDAACSKSTSPDAAAQTPIPARGRRSRCSCCARVLLVAPGRAATGEGRIASQSVATTFRARDSRCRRSSRSSRRSSTTGPIAAARLLQPYDIEVGAGTSHTATFLRALGPEPWRAAYVQPSRRPKDGRYGENPNRLQHYYQYQVVLKPAPADILDLYLGSLVALGFDLTRNDVRFVEDDWENPTLGAWGLGWEVWLNGMEVTQFTYFQQVGGLDCNPITGEITYGLERLAMYLQGKENVFDLVWTTSREDDGERVLTYGDVYHQNEVEQSTYNFERSNAPRLAELVRVPRGRGEAPARSAAAAARLRNDPEGRAHVQPARRARRDLGHRARSLHRSASAPFAAGRAGLRRVARGARLSDAARKTSPRTAPRR